MDMTKKCATCGAEYGESTRFCSRCGSNQFVPLMAAAPAAMKRCAQCGAECKPAVRFCSTCGCGDFVADAPIPVPAPTPAPAPKPQAEEVSNTRKGGLLVTFIAIMALLLIAVILIVLLPQSPSSSGDSGSNGDSVSNNGGTNNDDSNNNSTLPSTPDVTPDDDSNFIPDTDNPNYNDAGYYEGYYDSASHEQNAAPANITKTVMVYIVGSNLESQGQCASKDLEEIRLSGVDTTKNNILIYTGGAKHWHTPGLSGYTDSILRLDGQQYSIVNSLSSQNMGSSATLASFLDFGRRNYPADSYSLILWDHGGGPIGGYGHDELHDDLLTMNELQAGLQSGGFGNGSKLEFIGFDACLMASIETAWCLKNYANYMVASQELEPGCGWDYSFLASLNRYNRGDAIGKEIIDSYFYSLRQHSADLTLSCLNLNAIDKVAQQMDQFFRTVDTDISAGSYSNISRCRYNTKAFAKSSGAYDLVDLRHMTALLGTYYPTESRALTNALNQFIAYNRTNTINANGVSVYHPYEDREYLSVNLAEYTSFGFSDAYTDYISNFAEFLIDDSQADWDSYRKAPVTVTSTGNKHTISMQLTEEQTANFAGASYFIVRKLENDDMFDDQYLFTFMGYDTTLTENGLLSASYGGKTVYAVSHADNQPLFMPIMMYQTWDGTGALKYVAPGLLWYMESLENMEIVGVDFQINIIDGKPQIVSAVPDDTAIPGKQDVDYMQCDYIWFTTAGRTPTYDTNGNLLPFMDWTQTGDQIGTEVVVDDGFHLELFDIEDTENYYAMFVVYDTQGNTYNSQLIPLAS